MICDFAETYHILNYKELSPYLLATLLSGLEENSRVKRKISGVNYSTDTLLLANIADSLSFICWTKTEDGTKNRNRPKSILSKLLGNDEATKEIKAFNNADEFEKARAKLLEEKLWQQN